MLETIIAVGLQVLGYFLKNNADSEKMQELFYKFVDRQHNEYLNSAKMRVRAQERMKSILEKPFVETP